MNDKFDTVVVDVEFQKITEILRSITQFAIKSILTKTETNTFNCHNWYECLLGVFDNRLFVLGIFDQKYYMCCFKIRSLLSNSKITRVWNLVYLVLATSVKCNCRFKSAREDIVSVNAYYFVKTPSNAT